jgi:hypothetical protein
MCGVRVSCVCIEEYLGLVGEDLLHLALLAEVGKGEVEAHGRGDLGEVAVGAPVAVIHGRHVVAGLEHVEDGHGGRAARRKADACRSRVLWGGRGDSHAADGDTR